MLKITSTKWLIIKYHMCSSFCSSFCSNHVFLETVPKVHHLEVFRTWVSTWINVLSNSIECEINMKVFTSRHDVLAHNVHNKCITLSVLCFDIKCQRSFSMHCIFGGCAFPCSFHIQHYDSGFECEVNIEMHVSIILANFNISARLGVFIRINGEKVFMCCFRRAPRGQVYRRRP